MLQFQPAQAARTPDFIGAAGLDQRQENMENERKAHERNSLMQAGIGLLTQSNPIGWAALAALAYDSARK